jgi:glycosyltransferase involved in cell wall biosynthesis
LPDAGSDVAVAVPTRNGAADLDRTLAAVRRQTVPVAELVVLDSSSTDGTADVARRHGAAVHVIAARDFGHGSARNRLMELTRAGRVAFLTQDAEPAGDTWLAALLEPDAALAYGPYRARPGAPVSLRREYAEFFAARPRVWTAADLPVPPQPGPATFASSANLCLARAAWERVPFRDVAYAEDQQLGLDLLAAGFSKAYAPGAVVLHSHEYGTVERLRRYFDEFRALHDVYGFTAPASPRVLAGTVRAEVRKDRAFDPAAPVAGSVAFHATRVLGAALGTRAGRLPTPVRRRLSLEERA